MRDNLFVIQIPDYHFQSFVDGKINSWNVAGMKSKYRVGDNLVFVEFDTNNNREGERRIHGEVIYSFSGPEVGLPDEWCFFGFHTADHLDFIRDYNLISNKILPVYEDKLSHRIADSVMNRLSHVLASFDLISSSAVLQAKNFTEDAKTQFKALEIILEGITGHGNHTEKRVIANHCIHMLRQMIDRVDNINWEYSTQNFERYNYFRSQSPERTLMEKYRDLKFQCERLQEQLKGKGVEPEELPF